jgi:serine protease
MEDSMKKLLLAVILLCLASTLLAASSPMITPELTAALNATGSDELLDVILFMDARPDYRALMDLTSNLGYGPRRQTVVSRLKEFAQDDQAEVISLLNYRESRGQADHIRSLWINNTVAVRATRDVVLDLSRMEGIRKVALDMKRPALIAEGPSVGIPPAPMIEWNISLINAPSVWAMGFTGAGVVVGHFDTGVNYTHVDLADHIWVNSDETPSNGLDDDGNGYTDDYYGYNFADNTSDPRDDQGHGTHTAGTVASDGTAGDSCGVAPDAQIMGLKVLDATGNGAESDVWEAIQYAVDNGARVMTFSIGWMHAWNPDRHAWRDAFDAALAAGVIAAVASGNERSSGDPAPDNVRTPGDVPPPWLHPDQTLSGGLSGVVTVGATNSGDNYASFSSYGPVSWENESPWFDYPHNPEIGLIDPDVAAPGVDVTSCAYYNNTGYISGYSGTSMACPHAAGLMALMLSKNPSITPAEIDSIIEMTAIDRGPGGKDNDYGAGRINCLDAVNLVPISDEPYLFKQSHVIDDWMGNSNGRMDPGETVDLIVTLRNSGLDANNVQGVLRESDPYITLTDSLSTYGNIVSGATADNSSNPYVIVVDPSACDGYQVPFTLYITADGGYENTVSFSLTVGEAPPDWETHDVGNVRCTVTGFGSLGFAGLGGAGDGFEYPKFIDHLYYGSMAAGNSASYVVDRHFAPTGGDEDWQTLLCQGLKFGQTVYSDQDGWVRYDDSGHPTPHELEITQHSWAWAAAPHNDYVIIRYTMLNGGGSVLNGMYLGQFADFDMGADYSTNYAGTDAGRRMAYMYPNVSGPYVGIKLLDPTTAANLSAIDHDLYVYPGSEMSEQTKLNFLNGTYSSSQSNRPYDWSVMVSAGPFDLAPGDSEVVAVAILGGDDLSDLEDNADDAQYVYDGVPGISEKSTYRKEKPSFALYESHPNPFTASSRINYILAPNQEGSLKIYDAAGRIVRSFTVAGIGRRQYVVWDGTDDSGRHVTSGVYFCQLGWSGLRASKKVVVTR